jgi:hypothetical protein
MLLGVEIELTSLGSPSILITGTICYIELSVWSLDAVLFELSSSVPLLDLFTIGKVYSMNLTDFLPLFPRVGLEFTFAT